MRRRSTEDDTKCISIINEMSNECILLFYHIDPVLGSSHPKSIFVMASSCSLHVISAFLEILEYLIEEPRVPNN